MSGAKSGLTLEWGITKEPSLLYNTVRKGGKERKEMENEPPALYTIASFNIGKKQSGDTLLENCTLNLYVYHIPVLPLKFTHLTPHCMYPSKPRNTIIFET